MSDLNPNQIAEKICAAHLNDYDFIGTSVVADKIKELQNCDSRFSEIGILEEATKRKLDGYDWIKSLIIKVPKGQIEILKNKNLIDKIVEEVNKKIEGEKETIKCLILVSGGRLVKNASPTSYNIKVSAASGTGKDYVTKATLETLYSTESYIYRSRISEQAFTYWHEKDDDWTWSGKILYLEDVSSKLINCDTFKVMSSAGTDATIVRKQKAVDIKIRGKPVLIVTTASAKAARELERRFPNLTLDESGGQTRNILKRHASYAKTGIMPELDQTLIEAIRTLKPVNVVIPYADGLPEMLSGDNLILRTAFPRFLDYIKASAAWHQHQRKTDENGNLMATDDDYELAREVLLNTISTNTLVSLDHQDKKILELLKSLERKTYSTDELQEHIKFLAERQLRRRLDSLCERDIINKTSEMRESGRKAVIVYSYKETDKLVLPSKRNKTSTTTTTIKTIKTSTTSDRLPVVNVVLDNKITCQDSNKIVVEHEPPI